MMGSRRAYLVLCIVGALAAAAIAGEAAEAAAPAAAPGDMFDQLKNVQAAGIQFKFGGEARLRYEFWDGYDIDEYRPIDRGPIPPVDPGMAVDSRRTHEPDRASSGTARTP